MRTVIRFIESISEQSGRIISWLCLVLVLVLVFEVAARYIFNMPTMWVFDTSRMLGGSIIVLGWAYVHLHHGHIRIDTLYLRLSPRRKAIVDVVGCLIFLFPMFIFLIISAVDKMLFSYEYGEILPMSYWQPSILPFRIVVLVGFVLFILQGGVQFIRDLHLLVKNKTYD